MRGPYWRISAQGLDKTEGHYSPSTVLSKLGLWKIYIMLADKAHTPV